MAKRRPAPGWHLPHVVGRFFRLTVERGSAEARMLWTPWQLAQLATDCEPVFAARPWKDSSKLTMRSAGRPKRLESLRLPWHWPQVSRILLALTPEPALRARRM